jgi:hypothetical protein
VIHTRSSLCSRQLLLLLLLVMVAVPMLLLRAMQT